MKLVDRVDLIDRYSTSDITGTTHPHNSPAQLTPHNSPAQLTRTTHPHNSPAQPTRTTHPHNPPTYPKEGDLMQAQPYLFFDGRCEEAVESTVTSSTPK